MRLQTVAFGIILLIVGVAIFAVSSYTDLLFGRTHHYIPAGGIGIAVLGGILSILGATSKATATTEFKCASCGATFGSEMALKSHTKDKHGSAN
jgi:hypothetical protein